MTTMQRIIKYCAMAFAIMLSVSIITLIVRVGVGIAAGVTLFDNIVGTDLSKDIVINDSEEVTSFTKDFNADEISNLDISNYSGTMSVVSGDTFRVEAKNVPIDYVAEIRSGETLYLGYENDTLNEWNFWFDFGIFEENSEITVYIPASFMADKAQVDSASGKISVTGIHADQIIVDSGSGSISLTDCSANTVNFDSASGMVNINNVTADITNFSSGSGSIKVNNSELGVFDMDSASGSVTIEDTDVTNLTLSCGSGRVSFENGTINGDIEIDSASGKVTVVADANIGDYEVSTEAGSGGIWINGEKKDDYDQDNDNAIYELNVDSGSGRVSVDLKH